MLSAEVALAEAKLRLMHIVGLPLDSELSLSDSLTQPSGDTVTAETVVPEALDSRLELRILRAELKKADYELQSAEGKRLPELAVSGSLALSGQTPDTAGSAGEAAVRLSLPLFTGGGITADIRRAATERDKIIALTDDAKVQVEEEVRVAVKRMSAAAEQVFTTDKALSLAKEELDMSQSRFVSGIGDNMELVNSQTAVSEARAARVEAMAGYENARIALSLAEGHTRGFSILKR